MNKFVGPKTPRKNIFLIFFDKLSKKNAITSYFCKKIASGNFPKIRKLFPNGFLRTGMATSKTGENWGETGKISTLQGIGHEQSGNRRQY